MIQQDTPSTYYQSWENAIRAHATEWGKWVLSIKDGEENIRERIRILHEDIMEKEVWIEVLEEILDCQSK